MPAPAYIVQHTYLGEGLTMHPRRPIMMMANRIEDEHRADCSGRALATLVIAWVGAALVASVLLKWTHMWVSLAVLTLLFLAACGYAAWDARKTQERVLARETERQEERRRRREQQLESVSGGIDNFPEITDPPDYQSFWVPHVPDLPPSYTSAVSSQPAGTTTTPLPARVSEAEEVSAVIPPRLSNPPPYAVAVQSEPLFLPMVQGQSHGESAQTPGNPPAGGHNLNENGQTSSPPANIADQDKIEEGHNTQPTRTRYLTSILNSTFGRNTRRTAHNAEQGTTPGGQTNGDRVNETQNNRNREQSFVNNSNNNDRIINNNNNPTGPPPQYPVTLRHSD